MDFSIITDEMMSSLSETERKKYDCVREAIESGGLVSPMIVKWFSELGFMLAWDSMKSGKAVEIARPLGEIFGELTKTTRVSLDTKSQLKGIISEGILDYAYAGGNHSIMSLRLAAQAGRGRSFGI